MRCRSVAFFFTLFLSVAHSQATDGKEVRIDRDHRQLLVQGRPFVIFGGELGNSSAGTSAQADAILPAMARTNLNTVLIPVAWEEIEPREGTYDFSVLDHWIDVARQERLHLGLLWFGSWKNAFSEYAPEWVKADNKRFPRALAANGTQLEILSTLGAETERCDSRAFAALMAHLRDKDRERQTVLLVQVENEVGYLGSGRDRSPEADRLFSEGVPPQLIRYLLDRRTELPSELAEHFHPEGRTWKEAFGPAANEVFMAWRYASYIEAVAQAGKKEYSLPMYANAQLPAPLERPGEYPSGGPHPYYLDVYRAAAPHLDFYSPDIYWPEFEYWVGRYRTAGNPVFIPEARLAAAPYNSLYAYGAASAFGFSPFGVDDLKVPESADSAEPTLAQVYAALTSLGEALPEAQSANRTRGIVLHANSPRSIQTVELGGYLFQASLSRSWPSNALLANDGALLLLESAANEFLVVGSGLAVQMSRDPDTDAKIAGIASIEEVSKAGSEWNVSTRLNGDQSDQGRRLIMDAHRVRIYRVRLYAIPR
jgi:beta-galactosidase GanA